jgi:hypothetical protein
MIFHNHKVQFIGIPKAGSYSVWESLYDENLPQDGKYNTHDHWKLQDVRSPYPTYCVIRNPWDRAVSGWNMMPGRGDLYDKLKSVLLKIYNKSQYEFVFHPQVDFISIDGEIRVDHILKFENLQNDWNKHFNVPLKHSNKTHDKIHVEIDDKTDELIRLIYRKDIELWNSLKN